MPKHTLPPLAPQVQYTICEVEHEEQTVIPAPVSPNPSTDGETQRDVMNLLRDATGKDYVILENYVSQKWGASTFDYIAMPLPLPGLN